MPIRILLIRNTLDRPDNFARYFQLRHIVHASVFYDQLTSNFDLSGYDGIVLSGTDYPALTHNLPLYANEIRLIQTTLLPVLGICGGLHIICQAYGGRLNRLEEPLYGRIQVHYKAGERLFDGLPAPCSMFARHRYFIDQSPPGFRTIARSWPHGVIYALRHFTKPQIGLQFHPERRNDGYCLLDNYFRILQAARNGSHPTPSLQEGLPLALRNKFAGRACK